MRAGTHPSWQLGRQLVSREQIDSVRRKVAHIEGKGAIEAERDGLKAPANRKEMLAGADVATWIRAEGDHLRDKIYGLSVVKRVPRSDLDGGIRVMGLRGGSARA